MLKIPKKKLNKYNNISKNTEEKINFYLLDLEIKEILFKYLEILEDSLKFQLISVIWDCFLSEESFREKFLEKRKKFNKEKIEELEKRYKKIDEKIFFMELTFWELVRYFKDLKREYKEKVVDFYWFKEYKYFENWIFEMRYLRNLVCHWENIFNRKFEWSLKWNRLKKILKVDRLNDFRSYLLVLELFNLLIWWRKLILSEIYKNKKTHRLFEHTSIEVEAWWVFIKWLYKSFIKKQEKIEEFFERKIEKNEKITIFPENNLKDLGKIIEEEKKKWKTIVWTNGCFDIMHPGHIETFKKAKELWDILVVWLNWKDSPYWKTKPWRPINNEFYRSVMLANLKQVDYVYIFNDKTPAIPVDVLKPDIVLKWWDYYLWKWIVKSEKWIIENKELKYLLENIEKFIVNKNWILDITWIYNYILENNLEEEVRKISWFMWEWLVNVKNWWKVILVPIVEGCSTTNIVEKIKKLN